MYSKSHSTGERVKTIKELQIKWVLKQKEKEKQAPAEIDGVSTNSKKSGNSRITAPSH